jgi:iron complex outermembrane recepter protein
MENKKQPSSLSLLREFLIFISLFSFGEIPAAWADSSGIKAYSQSNKTNELGLGSIESIRKISTHQQVSTSAKDLIAQENTNITRVTGIEVDRTDKGLQVILQTIYGQELVPSILPEGNNLVLEIPNATLAFSIRNGVRELNPTPEISEVSVVKVDETNIRVIIVGSKQAPTAQIIPSDRGLVLNVTSQETTAQNETEPELEILVTGEREIEDSYRIPNTSVGSRTDVPLRDVPQSIQVVPQQVLRDQQITRLNDALRNVPGVTQDFDSGPYVTYRIRGFEALNNNLLRNGQVDPGAGEIVEFSSIDRVEVLKGPASVLFGLGNPGGSINLITKQPLRETFYNIDATIGSYDFYRGAIDLSGPLNESKSVLYRFNTAYRNSDSFIDFYNSDYFNVSPVVSIAIGKKTNLILEGDYSETKDSGFTPFVPVVGSVLDNPNGEIPRDRNVGEPTDEIDASLTRLGYRLEHKFNDRWSLNNAFTYNFRDYSDKKTLPGDLEPDNRTLNRTYREFDFQSISYTLATNAVGKFSTGSIEHQLLFGIDLNSFENKVPSYIEVNAAPIDIFNPIYAQPPDALSDEISNTTVTKSLGIYLQDQISLIDNLKVLLGGRFDAFDLKSEDFSTDTESNLSDSDFSPRFGIVYQPIPAISVYASYISSFTAASGLFLFGGSLDNSAEPESGRQYEIGVKADLSDKMSATLALYDLTRTNVLTEDPDNPGFQIQTGEQNSQGIELNLTGEIVPGWNVIAGYAYTDAQVTEDNTITPGNKLPNTPNHAANLWTTYEIQQGDLKGFGAGLGLFFVGDRAGDLENTYDIPSYVRTDAAIFYNRDKFRAALNFKNLFDLEYFENGSSSTRVNYGQPFTVQGTVSLQF